MTCPDDEWDEWLPDLLFTDDSEDWPLDPPPRPIRDVIRDLADYQPTR
ncbi:hypothetical protein ACGF07_25610 [Kitasatospora sp. NPDC048194]